MSVKTSSLTEEEVQRYVKMVLHEVDSLSWTLNSRHFLQVLRALGDKVDNYIRDWSLVEEE